MLDLSEIAAILTAGRTPNGQLSSHARAVMIGAVAGGKSQSEVARAFGVSRNTVSVVVRRFLDHHTFEDLPGRGRPEALTPQDKRYLSQKTKRQPQVSLKQLANDFPGKVSVTTLRRHIKRNPVPGRGAVQKDSTTA